MGIDTDLKLHIDGKIVEQVWVFKYLGVMLNETLTWSDWLLVPQYNKDYLTFSS